MGKLVGEAQVDEVKRLKQKAMEEVERQRAVIWEGQIRSIKKTAAEAATTLAGIEDEVSKAETKVRELEAFHSSRRPNLEELAEKIDDTENAIDAARDFLSAATEQALRLGGEHHDSLEPEALSFAKEETKKLVGPLDALQARLHPPTLEAKKVRDRLTLMQKKAG